jgi:hypothetical protein
LFLGDLTADVGNVFPFSVGQSAIELENLTYSATHPDISGWYQNNYVIINRANTALEYIPAIKMPDARKEQMLAECKYLRGLAYFYLVSSYGPVPMPLQSTKKLTGLELPRTPEDEVYAQVIKDLTEAAAALPAVWPNTSSTGAVDNATGRATEGAAKALLARVYLFRKEYQRTADLTQEIIGSGRYGLFDNYRDVFAPQTKNGPEHIFSVQFEALPGQGGPTNRWLLPCCHRTWNGANWAQVMVHERWRGTIPNHYRKNGVVTPDSWVDLNGNQVAGWAGRPTYKYFYNGPVSPQQTGAENWPILRYADVLLMRAEALNELNNGPTAEAVTLVNQIRKRARTEFKWDDPKAKTNMTRVGEDPFALPDIPADISKRDFFQILVDERGIEFAFEGLRRWDLIRWGIFKEVMKNYRDNVEDKHLLLPIPQAEMALNKSWTQNFGY